jgi:hypothetical protein
LCAFSDVDDDDEVFLSIDGGGCDAQLRPAAAWTSSPWLTTGHSAAPRCRFNGGLSSSGCSRWPSVFAREIKKKSFC